MPFPFSVMLLPTTASPSQPQIQSEVQAAVLVDAGQIGPDGAVRSSDRTSFRIDGNAIVLTRLSPGICKIIFDAALGTNTYVLTDGSVAVPVKMKGSVGQTPEDLPTAVTAATPSDLCLRLEQRFRAWHRYVRSAQAQGILDRHGEPVAPPASPGTEVRLAGDPSRSAARCDAAEREMIAQMGWSISRTVVSRNPKWGVVWRADVTSAKAPESVFRDVCWRRPGHGRSIAMSTQPLMMFDPGQSVAPLAPE
jgi:hypothetical protein